MAFAAAAPFGKPLIAAGHVFAGWAQLDGLAGRFVMAIFRFWETPHFRRRKVTQIMIRLELTSVAGAGLEPATHGL